VGVRGFARRRHRIRTNVRERLRSSISLHDIDSLGRDGLGPGETKSAIALAESAADTGL
jgi:hypothetical protein